ncbi:alpha/beta fold hydrolase [Methylotenera sp.]|uniref:alpha/beta fold hydrolase n=1 Tax=Methylotenera sp. TaxID=2051956 RepID=UPI0027331D5B|nr:alpha/beta hydrolase [Methylotenera sp.]MDP3308617.1 alpha/beta hydrolase [Methylotenera sp.]
MNITTLILLLLATFAIPWLVSFVIEALRPAPKAPAVMPWDQSLKPSYIMVDGVNIRYIKTGQGPTLVLLHTLRTQLDLFHKVIPELSKNFTVYAPDYPGHGYSDIVDGAYDADFFVKNVEGFLNALDLKNVTLSGVSIGATISLLIAARRNPRVTRIIPINPYDYYQGKGLARSSDLGRFIVAVSGIPFIGETVVRLRNFIIMKAVLNGGVSDATSISPQLMKEMYVVGNRSGHYRAFLKLLRNSQSWEQARSQYGNINVPTLIIWGSEDWSLLEERNYDESLIPGVQSITLKKASHFLPFDAPQELISQIRTFITQ